MGAKEGIAVTILLIVTAFVSCWFLYTPDERLEINFLNIGQGDAALIKTPRKKTILIDGGPPTNAVLRELGKVLPFWQRNIDLIIVSHPHDDHFGGLSGVAQRYRVGAVMITDYAYESAAYKEFLEIIKNKSIPIIYAKQEDLIIDGVTFNIIYPAGSLADDNIENANNASIALRVSYGEIDTLFSGDAELELENQLLATVKNELDSEILKLGHHGSDTSSSELFLDAVSPELAIASAGVDNSYGHPSPRILKRLERRAIKSYRTDLDGTIRLKTDGEKVYHRKACIISCSPL